MVALLFLYLLVGAALALWTQYDTKVVFTKGEMAYFVSCWPYIFYHAWRL